MVYVDWNKIMAITPENFTDDDKEELEDSVVWYSPPSDIGRKQLAALIKVLQEIVKHKTDQVESVMGALDELAAKQGEEVARGRQELLVELEELREQVEYQRRLERDTEMTDDQLRSELVRLEMQNEELVQELQEREKDLTTEKSEVERLVGEVARLEREKLHVVRELSALQDETNERLGRGVMDSPESGVEKVEELLDMIRQKNKHIMQLLDDIEAVEQENQALKVKIANLKDQLSENSKEISELSDKAATLQASVDDRERKILELTDQNKALTAQISDLLENKSKHDKDLDEFAVTLNSRVEEWRRLLDMKDTEIITVKDELKKYLSTSKPWNEVTSDAEVKSHILQQEQDIIKLKTELAEAHKDITKNNEVVEKLTLKLSSMENRSELNLKITALEMQVSDLQDELKAVEEDATSKGEEITKLVVQLRAYEREEFGLAEAIDQVKKLEKRLYDRESRLETIIASCNKLSIEKGNLEDENAYLREKLGLSPTHEVDSSSVRRKSEADAITVKKLQYELEKVTDEVIELKIKNRELSAKLVSTSVQEDEAETEAKIIEDVPIAKKDSPDLADLQLLEKKYNHLICENDALRKGMHEILESIQRETLGDVEISSLERLLEALDARHISGWYHPAMRLQAQLNSTKGECKELRNQIRTLLEERKALINELQAARTASNENVRKGDALIDLQIDNTTKYKCEETSDDKIAMERRCIELENTVSLLEFAAEKAEADWMNQRRNILKEKDAMAIELANYTGRDHEKPELNSFGLSQVVEFLKVREVTLEEEILDLRKSFIEKEEKSLEKVMALQKDKLELLSKLRKQENQILFLEPTERVVTLEKELASLRLQYNIAVASRLTVEHESNRLSDIGVLKEDWDNINRRELLNELRAAKEKLHETEALLNSCGNSIIAPDTFKNQLSILASKLSAAEVREASEKQRNVHLEKVCEIFKAERVQLDAHVGELTEQLRDEKVLNEKLQLTLNDLDFKNRSELCGESYKVAMEVELKYEKLLAEKKNIEELLNISRMQFRTLQAWQSSEKIERDSLNNCIMLLQTSPGEKLALLKMNHELAAAKKANVELVAKNAELSSCVSHVTAECMAKDLALSEASAVTSLLKCQNLTTAKFLFRIVDQIYNAFSGALFFPSINKALKLLTKTEELKTVLEDKIKKSEEKERDLAIKEEEFVVQLEALHDLKAAFQSDSKNLINWHNKSTELRLRETRCKRHNDFLTDELARLEAQNKMLIEEIRALEDNAVIREREWDEERKEWLKHQLQVLEEKDLIARIGQPLSIGAKKRSSTIEKMEFENMQRKISELMNENERLSKEISEKESIYKEELSEKTSRLRSLELLEAVEGERVEKFTFETLSNKENKPEKVALQVTINSLQSIIKQKDLTLSRYQEILKRTREDHENTMRRLQSELKNVHNALAKQSKAYSRLKHGAYQPVVSEIEKYVAKIQELDEELTEVRGSLKRVNERLKLSQQEAGKWKTIAEEKMAMLEETRERMEIELERYREEMQSQEMELHNLRQLTMGGPSKQLLETMQDLQQKLNVYGDSTERAVSARDLKSEDRPIREESANESSLQRQLKASREECSRLREQVKSLRDLKRRPASARAAQDRDNLVGKIHKLEEMLQLSKQHEQELEVQGLKKIRSIEEVTRWDERKRHQQSIEKLANQLKQKKMEVTVALSKLETMRGLLSKMEREKAAMEAQLKQISDSSRVNTKMEQLLEEKEELAAQVVALEEEIRALQRHQDGKAAAILHEKLDSQERKLATLELSQQAPTEIAEELERLNKKVMYLERRNLQLDTENLNLKLSSEKLRTENQQLQQFYRRLEADKKARSVSPSANPPSRSQVRMAYDNQREVNKLKSELTIVKQQLMDVINTNADMDQEIQRLTNQIKLWEEKDSAMSLAKSKQQLMINDLHQELNHVKGQLAHKMHLLDRVKILLSKAAAKEKALNEKVAALQTMMKGHSG